MFQIWLKKPFLEKKKMLITSIFSISLYSKGSSFRGLMHLQKVSIHVSLHNLHRLAGADPFCYLNPFPNKPWFLHVCCTSLLKALWEKDKLFLTSNFSFSLSVFYPFGEISTIFIKFEVSILKLFQFGRV